jgi:hypothetical protein
MITNDMESALKGYSSFFSKSSWTFVYNPFFKKIQDRSNSYNRIYGQTPRPSGVVRIGYNSYLPSSFWFRPIAHFGVGLGYRSAMSKFINGEPTGSQMVLWAMPLDLGAGLETPLVWSLFKLGGIVGPSLLLFIQNRSDLEESDKRKRYAQYGPGYFFEGFFKLSLNNFFSSTVHGLYKSYGIVNMSFVTSWRKQFFKNFQSNDIRVSGELYGIGLNFEYL